MSATGPSAFFRQVLESDLPYIARCIGEGAGLTHEKWNNILKSLELQFWDEEDCWRPHAWVMVVEGEPVFLLEIVNNQVFFTGPPSLEMMSAS